MRSAMKFTGKELQNEFLISPHFNSNTCSSMHKKDEGSHPKKIAKKCLMMVNQQHSS